MAETEDAPVGRLPRTVIPEAYSLALTIVPERETFHGETEIEVTVNEATDRIWLHGRDLSVTDVAVIPAGGDSMSARYTQVDDSGVARLDLEESLPAGKATLRFRYSAPFNRQLQGLYKVEEEGAPYVFTQLEPISARLVFPGFDEPAFKVPFDITLTVPEDQVAITATPPVAERSREDGLKEIRFARTRPLPTYLLAFIVGDFDVVDGGPIPANEVRERAVPLRGVAAKGKGPKLQYILENTERILAGMERYFGIPYPYRKLDLIAVPDFAAGAMENVGAITYRDTLILVGETPSLDQLRRARSVHAHELAHQWFGNLVTPEWWNDIWLNEAFATWLGNRFMHDLWPDEQFDRGFLSYVHEDAFAADSQVSARQIRQPVEDRNGITSAFDGITYAKGAGVLAMVEEYVGPAIFRQGIRQYLLAHADGTAVARDLFAAIADAAGNEEVIAAFRSFVEQPGLPLVEASLQCGDDAEGGGHVTLEQSRYLFLGSEAPEQQMWRIPVCLALREDGAWRRQCTLLGERRQDVPLPAGQCPDAVLPNANGAGYYRWDMAEDDWPDLMAVFETLSPREQMSVADSVTAAFRAGRLKQDEYLETVASMAQSDSWEAVLSPLNALSEIIGRISEPEERPALKARIAQSYIDKLAALGLDADTPADRSSPVETARARDRLTSFMALSVDYDPLRQALLERAKAYMGYGGDEMIHPEAIGPDLAGTALSVAAEEEGPKVFDTMMRHFERTDDVIVRSQMINALARISTPELVDDIRALALSPKLRGNEINTVLWRQMARYETRAGMWAWIKANYPALSDRLSARREPMLISVTRNFCMPEAHADVEAFFEPRIAEMEGGPRTFAQTLESIEVCMALKEHNMP